MLQTLIWLQLLAQIILRGGSDTYLSETCHLDTSDANLITTSSISSSSLSSYYPLTTATYAAASINFSGLGTSYSFAELIGTGFDSTCQTCWNHYSVQFLTTDLLSSYSSDASWSYYTDSSGNQYGYCMIKSGNDWTLYVDIESMEDNGITDGIGFTNTLVAIMDTAGFDDHYTQYATSANDATLYILDDRKSYASSGTSKATNASFSSHAYGTDMTVSFDVSLSDSSDSSDYMKLSYEYDYSELFDESNLVYTYTVSASGAYVASTTTVGEYELYDASVHSSTVTRYALTSVSLNTGSSTLDDYLADYIKKIISDSVSSTSISLTSDYTRYSVSADVNDNAAMVTEYNTPRQAAIYNPNTLKEAEFLNIQCSSNANDFIRIQKQKLSLKKLGLLKLSVDTESKATKGISVIAKALKMVNAARSTYGAYQNRLEHAYNINQNTAENTQSAESIIRDTDMANEMVKYMNLSILTQAGDAMIAQANQSKQLVLQMLA